MPDSLPRPVVDRLSRLAPDQRSAATAPPGPVLCVAPAGSGKTTTVVARIAWRVAIGVDPAMVTAMTFNRAAAVELQQRADAAMGELGYEAGTVRVRTFHALGREVLADGGVDVSHIVDRSEVLRELAGAPLPATQHRHLDEAFTRLKLDPARGPGPGERMTHQAFAAYQRHLRQLGAIDLDDLVALAGPALRRDPDLLRRWRRRAGVLFVDEAQDLDKSQLDLALLLAGERRDIFLVGDDDQTIYAWRLADVRRVLGLAARLPGLRRVDLRTNHRCAPEVVRRAARLVEHNRERFDKAIEPSSRTSGAVRLLPDPGDAVSRARLLLRTWVHEDAAAPHAILARTNRELVPFAAVALELGLSVAVEDDGLLLDADWDQLLSDCDAHVPLLPALAAAATRVRMPAERTAAVMAWAAGYEDAARLRAALAERRLARDRLCTRTANLTLATAHGTKGLEWDHVACIGHDDGGFPSGRALREADDPARALEEERRLAYVAWTRARVSLTIVYDPGAPSVFVREAFDRVEWA